MNQSINEVYDNLEALIKECQKISCVVPAVRLYLPDQEALIYARELNRRGYTTTITFINSPDKVLVLIKTRP